MFHYISGVATVDWIGARAPHKLSYEPFFVESPLSDCQNIYLPLNTEFSVEGAEYEGFHL